jgi:Astacin (Peptidase family M12A)
MRNDFFSLLTVSLAIFADSAALAQGFKPISLNLEGKQYSFQVLATPEGKRYGYVDLSTRWPVSANGSTVIYVCWENSNSDSGKERQEVQEAITNTWRRNSKLEFKGWGQCEEKSSGIRIYVSDSGPHTLGLGRQLDGVNHGMVLNFAFKKWGDACDISAQKRDYCIKAIAVHEFGHAIGFAHEQNRPDKPGDCLQPSENENATMLTPYDPHSVMNYCNEKYNNDGMLSELDLDALHQVYGAR